MPFDDTFGNTYLEIRKTSIKEISDNTGLTHNYLLLLTNYLSVRKLYLNFKLVGTSPLQNQRLHSL